MQGVAAAIDEPIAGGRHKVFGNHELAVIPQTSTIASHLPRAIGVAIAIDRARKLGVECCLARRRRRRLQLRRRLAEPRDRPGGAQHDGACRAPASSRAAALRLRGQRDRDQRALTCRMGRERALERGRPPLRERPTVMTLPRRSPLRARWPTGCARPAARPCSTSAPFATSAMQEPMSRPPTARPPTVRADLERDPLLATAAVARRGRCPHRGRARPMNTSRRGSASATSRSPPPGGPSSRARRR